MLRGHTLRNRVILASKDKVKFYTHASVVCMRSDVLDRYYHGKCGCFYAIMYTFCEPNLYRLSGIRYSSGTDPVHIRGPCQSLSLNLTPKPKNHGSVRGLR